MKRPPRKSERSCPLPKVEAQQRELRLVLGQGGRRQAGSLRWGLVVLAATLRAAGPCAWAHGGGLPRGHGAEPGVQVPFLGKQVLGWAGTCPGGWKQAACSPRGNRHAVRNRSRSPFLRREALSEGSCGRSSPQSPQAYTAGRLPPARPPTRLHQPDQCLQRGSKARTGNDGERSLVAGLGLGLVATCLLSV